jgi:hypothetical protein
MSNIEAMFANMATAKQMASGQHFKGEGAFVLRTKAMKVNDGHKGRFFVAEFEILASSSAQDPVGTTRSWAVPLTGERAQYSFGDIKGLVFALCGTNPKDVPQPEVDPAAHVEATQLVMAACDAEYAATKGIDTSLLVGQTVCLTTFYKATKPKPVAQPDGTFKMVAGTFTVHQWTPAAQEGGAS